MGPQKTGGWDSNDIQILAILSTHYKHDISDPGHGQASNGCCIFSTNALRITKSEIQVFPFQEIL